MCLCQAASLRLKYNEKVESQVKAAEDALFVTKQTVCLAQREVIFFNLKSM